MFITCTLKFHYRNWETKRKGYFLEYRRKGVNHLCSIKVEFFSLTVAGKKSSFGRSQIGDADVKASCIYTQRAHRMGFFSFWSSALPPRGERKKGVAYRQRVIGASGMVAFWEKRLLVKTGPRRRSKTRLRSGQLTVKGGKKEPSN
ncbi:hypothetical protein CEXT_346381 [Caerostris extrusa]|uniref:Uncharacterized protein n=1 Tax=Caerostris extrusa TaxID=172846 RepID=A0AAV4VM91_CAEEX|nr:hypothetical protein CEXT_346381 [Caerostris extrusa]